MIDLEVIVVDNDSNDQTQEVFEAIRRISKMNMKIVIADKIGLGYARNRGITESSGDLIVFTDDDCYLEEEYFVKLLSVFNPNEYQYGTGDIFLFNSEDDPHVACQKIRYKKIINQRSPIIPAGMVQGANMFFLREVFEKSGYFDEYMGAGTQFPCEDIEMACRASNAGFTGVRLPGFIVYHDHGRKLNSKEALKAVHDYDYGRGAYYANLIIRGEPSAWRFWQNTFTRDKNISSKEYARISRELTGAAKYFMFLADKN
jgi:GT2 family glycosyltransferase